MARIRRALPVRRSASRAGSVSGPTVVNFTKNGKPVEIELVINPRGLASGETLRTRIESAVDGRVEVAPMEVEAARFRVDADKELGRPTPGWIRTVAGIGDVSAQL